jgi:hypothetical protein
MNKRRRIYIAGPMTGKPDYNFPAFRAAAERLQRAGWEAVNPAENFGGRTDLPRDSYLRADIELLLRCDAMAMLPGWRDSRGARLEYLLAIELGLELLDAETIEPLVPLPDAWITLSGDHETSWTILEDAAQRTTTNEQQEGKRLDGECASIARIWTELLDCKLKDGRQVTAGDVPLCLIAMYILLQANRPSRDNLVNIAGFARLAAIALGHESFYREEKP